MTQDNDSTDLDKCRDKIISLLDEYHCEIVFDDALLEVVVVDLDTNRFVFIDNGRG